MFDYLLAENKRVGDILGNSLFSSDEFIKDILRNNIYGVDLNEESVEITKLSLWLKTAQKGKKLTSLDKNIKCGNSLISDPDVADSKAFSWEAEFAEIFSRGGFDVVIGNPPYVRVQNIGSNEVDYYFKEYKSPSGKLDLSILFFEKGLELLQDKGRLAFVSSSQWLQTDYGKKIRKILSEGYVSEIIDFGSLPVFQDADTYPAIFTISKNINSQLDYGVIDTKDQLNDSSIKAVSKSKIPYTKLSEVAWQFNAFNLKDKLETNDIHYKPLSGIGKAYIGDLTGMDKAFVVTEAEIKKHRLEQGLLYPYAYRGNEIGKYGEVQPEAFVIYPYKKGDKHEAMLISEDDLMRNYPNIYSYLEKFRVELEKRMDSRKLYATGNKWFRHLRAGNFSYIEPKKLLFKGIGVTTNVGILGENTTFNGANCPAIILSDNSYSIEYIAAILNSKLVTYYLNSLSPKKLGGYYRYSATNISSVPVVENNDEVQKLAIKALELHKQHSFKNTKFQNLIRAEYDLDSLSPKLNKWWKLDFIDFTKYLKSNLSLAQKDDLLGLFDQYKSELSILDEKIAVVEDDINSLVYKLYCLTQEEINIVESKLN